MHGGCIVQPPAFYNDLHVYISLFAVRMLVYALCTHASLPMAHCHLAQALIKYSLDFVLLLLAMAETKRKDYIDGKINRSSGCDDISGNGITQCCSVAKRFVLQMQRNKNKT